jgi:hypothetical protein
MGWLFRCKQCGTDDIEQTYTQRSRTRYKTNKFPCFGCGDFQTKQVLSELPKSRPWERITCITCGKVLRSGFYTFFIENWD